ncbi:MAG: UTP--glucose-1-phosphate uridylyltransferase GalU [Pseudomonadota bacterium]|jgi:UTP--glucose-1-phosphate uridylyltransferase
MAKVRKAVFPVAGLGTRMLPAAKSVPKELLPVVDRPVIHYVVAEARAAGIEHFIFVTGRGKGALEDYFDHQVELEDTLRAKGKDELLDQLLADLPREGEISYVRQMAPLGLGHAVWCAREIVGDEPFAVLLPDVIVEASPSCLAQAVEAYNKVGGNIVVVERVPDSETHKYGIVAPASRDGRLIKMSGMVEKPAKGTAPSNLSVLGRYILQPEIFDILSEKQKGAGGEIQLTDAMAKLMETQGFHAFDYEGESFDCGDRLGWLKANIELAFRRADLGPSLKEALAQTLITERA